MITTTALAVEVLEEKLKIAKAASARADERHQNALDAANKWLWRVEELQDAIAKAKAVAS